MKLATCLNILAGLRSELESMMKDRATFHIQYPDNVHYKDEDCPDDAVWIVQIGRNNGRLRVEMRWSLTAGYSLYRLDRPDWHPSNPPDLVCHTRYVVCREIMEIITEQSTFVDKRS